MPDSLILGEFALEINYYGEWFYIMMILTMLIYNLESLFTNAGGVFFLKLIITVNDSTTFFVICICSGYPSNF